MNGQLTARPDRMRVPEVCRYCAVRLLSRDRYGAACGGSSIRDPAAEGRDPKRGLPADRRRSAAPGMDLARCRGRRGGGDQR